MYPPPIPPEHRTHPGIFHQAAIAGLVAPVLGIVAGGISQGIQRGQAANREAILVIAGIVVLMFLAGLISSVVALCGIPSHGKRRLLGFGLSGAVINGLMLFIFATNFVSARNAAIANRKGMEELTAAAEQFRTNTAKAYNPDTGIDANAQLKQTSEFRSRLDTASKTMTGSDAEAAQAIAVCMAKWEQQQRDFTIAMKAFDPKALMAYRTLTEKEQIEPRRQVVQTFLKASEDLRASVLKQTDDLQAELSTRPIPVATKSQIMAGFHSPSRAAIVAKALAIRDCDKGSCEAILGLLDLAESQWGRWRFDEDQNNVIFDDQASARSFSQLHAQINSFGQKELQLQGDVIELQKKAAAARKS